MARVLNYDEAIKLIDDGIDKLDLEQLSAISTAFSTHTGVVDSDKLGAVNTKIQVLNSNAAGDVLDQTTLVNFAVLDVTIAKYDDGMANDLYDDPMDKLNISVIGQDGLELAPEEQTKAKQAILESVKLEAQVEILKDPNFHVADLNGRVKKYLDLVNTKTTFKNLEMGLGEIAQEVDAAKLQEAVKDDTKRADLAKYLSDDAKAKLNRLYDSMDNGKPIKVTENTVIANLATSAIRVEDFVANAKANFGSVPIVASFNDKLKAFHDDAEKKYGKKYKIAVGIASAIGKAAPGVAFAMAAGTGPLGMAVYGVYQTRKSVLPLWKKFRDGSAVGDYKNDFASLKKLLKDNKKDAIKSVVGVGLGLLSAGVAADQAVSQFQELGSSGLTQAGSMIRRVTNGILSNSEKAYDLGVAYLKKDENGDRDWKEVSKKAGMLALTTTSFLGGAYLSDMAKEPDSLWNKLKGKFSRSEEISADVKADATVEKPAVKTGDAKITETQTLDVKKNPLMNDKFFEDENTPKGPTGNGDGSLLKRPEGQLEGNPGNGDGSLLKRPGVQKNPLMNDKLFEDENAPKGPTGKGDSSLLKRPEDQLDNVPGKVTEVNMPTAFDEKMGISKAQFNKLSAVYGADKLNEMYTNLSKDGVMSNFEGMTKEQVLFKFQRLDAWTDVVGGDGLTVDGAERNHYNEEMKDLNRLLNCGDKLSKEELVAAKKALGSITSAGGYTGLGKTNITDNAHVGAKDNDCGNNENKFKMGGGQQESPVQHQEPKIKTVIKLDAPDIKPLEVDATAAPLGTRINPESDVENTPLSYLTADGGKQDADLYSPNGGKTTVYQTKGFFGKTSQSVLRVVDGQAYIVSADKIEGLSADNAQVIVLDGRGKKSLKAFANDLNNAGRIGEENITSNVAPEVTPEAAPVATPEAAPKETQETAPEVAPKETQEATTEATADNIKTTKTHYGYVKTVINNEDGSVSTNVEGTLEVAKLSPEDKASYYSMKAEDDALNRLVKDKIGVYNVEDTFSKAESPEDLQSIHDAKVKSFCEDKGIKLKPIAGHDNVQVATTGKHYVLLGGTAEEQTSAQEVLDKNAELARKAAIERRGHGH